MTKATIAALIALIVAISAVSVVDISHYQQVSSLNSNITKPYAPISQSTNQQQIRTYFGYLVSYNYITNNANDVESTQLVFTNKTFNYAGYISLDNNCIYNVTYYDNNPNQALNVAKLNLTIGFKDNSEKASIKDKSEQESSNNNLEQASSNDNSEQASITNAQFTDNSHVTLTIQNALNKDLTITSATIDGFGVLMNATSIDKASSTDIELTASAAFVNSEQYQIKITTAETNALTYVATYAGP